MNFEFADFLYILLLLPLFLGVKILVSGSLPLKYCLLLIGFSFLVFSLAGYYRESAHQVKNFLILIDVTRSMTTQDMRGDNGEKISRLDFAKKEIARIADTLPKGTRIGIGATVTSPYSYTEDANIKIFWPIETVSEENIGDVLRALEIVNWWNAWGDKSEWPPFFTSIDWLLKQKRLPTNLNIIVITDGGANITEKQAEFNLMLIRSKAFLNEKIRLIFLGVGGDKILSVPEFDEKLQETGKCFADIFDKDRSCFKSRLEEKNLQHLAEILGGKASYRRLAKFQDLADVFADSRNLVAGKENIRLEQSDRFLALALVFIVLFFVI